MFKSTQKKYSTKTIQQMKDEVYAIPLRYRKMENQHIIFWLLKDISWCMIWRPLGIFMILPTLAIAIIIAYRTKAYMSERCHNFAIVFWIAANSYWMISEFLHFDELQVYGAITYKHLSIIPFCMGIGLLSYYYAWWKPRNKNVMESM